MSIHRYGISTTADVAVVATVAKTILQLRTPATRLARWAELVVGFKSNVASDVPTLVQIRRQTTDGTGSAVARIALRAGLPASLVTAFENFTVEPTYTDIIKQWPLTPIGGMLDYPIPLGRDLEMGLSDRWGIVVVAPQNQNVAAHIEWHE